SIQKIIGEDVVLISSAEEVAKEVEETLKRKKILQKNETRAEYTFCSTGDKKTFSKLGSKFLGKEINNVQKIKLQRIKG
ncbi:MAG: glutamate racemase, partial [Actinomycetia bacterium]|nr:glutamate racemase [Actinomycetes bacterium]